MTTDKPDHTPVDMTAWDNLTPEHRTRILAAARAIQLAEEADQ